MQIQPGANLVRTFTKLFVVYDNVACELFGAIIRAPNKEVARRSFNDLMQQHDSPIAKNREDYDLLYIGAIDNTGTICGDNGDLLDHLVAVIATGKEWIEANKENLK